MENRNALWPDGTQIEKWFFEYSRPKLSELGVQVNILDYGAVALNSKSEYNPSTKAIQNAIDAAAELVKKARGEEAPAELVKKARGEEAPAVVVIPAGIFMCGTVHLKPGVNLWLEKDAVLLGSPDVRDYELGDTRIEGQSCIYFKALLNAKDCTGLVIGGEGTIDGNGRRSWENFALRRKWNPKCTNKDEQRPRLVYIENSAYVTIDGITLMNAHFWTTHIYKCHHVRYTNLTILSPKEPVKAPSTDAIDVDASTDVHVKDCYMAVNDDAVAIKGGKGPWADTDETNGSNERILIEDCEYGFCHGCLTVGSESVHTKNVIVRNIRVTERANNLLWLKLRPDTPSEYEYITVEDVKGEIENFINVNPWTQFFDLQGRTDKPKSKAHHVILQNCQCECYNYFYVHAHDEQYDLYDFVFKDLDIQTEVDETDYTIIENCKTENVHISVMQNK